MKFLLFNITVIAALMYLFDGKTISIPKHVKATANQVMGSAKSLVSEQLKEIEVAPNVVKHAQKDIGTDKPADGWGREHGVLEPLGDKQDHQLTKALDEKLTKKKTVQGDEGGVQEKTTVLQEEFMHPADRQRELQKLAQDMEKYFLTEN